VKSANQKRVVLSFIDRINQHDADGLAHLMSRNHLFVDSLGNSVKGRTKMVEGWREYFTLFPDYQISVAEWFRKGSAFALFGTAGETYRAKGRAKKANKWKVPAAWRVRVENGRVSEWRVFADNYKTALLLQQAR
jgi:ketosteroid isomerase-like protein